MATPEAYSVSLSSRARRETRNLDRQTLTRIAKAIDGLAQNPRPPGCLKVKTSEGLWRIRVGDWRIGYEIDDTVRQVRIVTVGHRSEFYD
jgi:mRNA interferase RelE/StbE